MSPELPQSTTAIRQAVLLLALLVAMVAMGVAMLRGADLLHAAFTAMWVLPVAAGIIFQIFRSWFLVLVRSIQEKQAQAEADAAAAEAANQGRES